MDTVEGILAEMTSLVDGAGERSLTADEVSRYESMESRLTAAQRTDQVRARQTAYNTPVGPSVYHVAPSQVDDTLDRAFENYLRTGIPNQDITDLRIRNAQGSGTTAGGYMVPSGFRTKLVEVMAAFGGLASAVEVISTDTGGPLEYPSNDDTANSGGITAESAAITSGADLVFGTVTLGAYKYTSAGAGSNLPLRVPVELLQDSAFDVSGLVSRKLGERIARAQAAHWTTGTGSSQPLGLVASGTFTANVELDTPDTIDLDDIMDAYDALDPAYEQGASWVMKKNTWSQIRGIVDTNGRPIVQDSTTGVGGAPELRLLGFPVIIDQGMPTLSSAADGYCIAFGDLREAYVIRRVSSLVVVVNPYTRAANGEVEFTAWERADGTVQNRGAYVILSNNT